MSVLILQAIAEKRPDDIVMYDEVVMEVMKEDSNTAISGVGLLVHMAKDHKVGYTIETM